MLRYIKNKFFTNDLVVSQQLNNPEKKYDQHKIYEDFKALQESPGFKIFKEYLEDEIIRNHTNYAKELDYMNNKYITTEKERGVVIGRIEGYVNAFKMVDEFIEIYSKENVDSGSKQKMRENIIN